MPQFTTTDSLRFKSYLIAHGVDTSTAEKVAAKVQQKSQRNTPLTDEETALVEGYMIKAASKISTAESNVAHKVTAGGLKWQPITLKKGYIDTSQKVSEVGFKYFRPKPKIRVWGDPHVWDEVACKWRDPSAKNAFKAQNTSAYSPGTVRQLAYKVASS